MNGIIKRVAIDFESYPDVAISVGLLAAAGVLVWIALFSESKWTKAVALAYSLLP